MSIYIYCNF